MCEEKRRKTCPLRTPLGAHRIAPSPWRAKKKTEEEILKESNDTKL